MKLNLTVTARLTIAELLSHCRGFMSKSGIADMHASTSMHGTVASSSSGA